MNLDLAMDFLAGLRENNDKTWMDAHRATYLEVKDIWLRFTDLLINQLGDLDPLVMGLEAKGCVFRINRDIRFSKNKAPYKTNLGAFLAPGGKKGGYAGYYVHIEPGDRSFVAGGLYQPSTDVLQLVRQEIDYNADTLECVLNNGSFKNAFGALEGERLKRVPRGYDSTHPKADLLRMKSFLVMHRVEDGEVLGENFAQKVMGIFQLIMPFNQFLNGAISDLHA